MKHILLLAVCIFFWGCGDDDTRTNVDATIRPVDSGGSGCVDGAFRCDGNTRSRCESNKWIEVERCAQACSPNLGCVACVPGDAICVNNASEVCLPDGSGYAEPVACDEKLGLTCEVGTGRCKGACSAASLGTSYRGCEYYPTVTENVVKNSFEFAVAVSNGSGQDANVHIEGGALGEPITTTVAAGEVGVIKLPWVPRLKTCDEGPGGDRDCSRAVGARVDKGAYHLRSNRPVSVYQFSPLDYTKSGVRSYTNDASLLMPVNAMGTSFINASSAQWKTFPGLLAVTAAHDNTKVNVELSATPRSSPEFPVERSNEFMMNKGDVIQILSQSGDLTGSKVISDKPIQVIGGHACTNIPANVTACDHLEESIFPVSVLDAKYVVSAPATADFRHGRVRTIRIVATEADTTVVAEPALSLRKLNAPGDFLDVVGDNKDYVISADKKIMVVEYMHGQSAGGSIGDPAIVIAVPAGQFRSEYTVHAPQNYSENWVNLVMPNGTRVQIDGVDVGEPSVIGTSAFSVVRYKLPSKASGNYTFVGDQPFGITVYGYGSATSYWYAGGLDLDEIILE